MGTVLIVNRETQISKRHCWTAIFKLLALTNCKIQFCGISQHFYQLLASQTKRNDWILRENVQVSMSSPKTFKEDKSETLDYLHIWRCSVFLTEDEGNKTLETSQFIHYVEHCNLDVETNLKARIYFYTTSLRLSLILRTIHMGLLVYCGNCQEYWPYEAKDMDFVSRKHNAEVVKCPKAIKLYESPIWSVIS